MNIAVGLAKAIHSLIRGGGEGERGGGIIREMGSTDVVNARNDRFLLKIWQLNFCRLLQYLISKNLIKVYLIKVTETNI